MVNSNLIKKENPLQTHFTLLDQFCGAKLLHFGGSDRGICSDGSGVYLVAAVG